MSTDLSPESEQYLDRAVAAGMFHDRREAIDMAVALLKRREQLIRDVNAGIEQLERGQGKPFDVEAILQAVDARFEADCAKGA
jgi:Arc/MetJ-type ribon-helix-helix transcriptional regulator